MHCRGLSALITKWRRGGSPRNASFLSTHISFLVSSFAPQPSGRASRRCSFVNNESIPEDEIALETSFGGVAPRLSSRRSSGPLFSSTAAPTATDRAGLSALRKATLSLQFARGLKGRAGSLRNVKQPAGGGSAPAAAARRGRRGSAPALCHAPSSLCLQEGSFMSRFETASFSESSSQASLCDRPESRMRRLSRQARRATLPHVPAA